MPMVSQSSVGQKYATRAANPTVDFDKLKPGDKASEGKVWQHETVEGGGGGWFEGDDPALTKATAPPLTEEPAAPAPAGGGGSGGGGDLSGMALGGLSQARAPMDVEGFQELPAPGSVNPALGSRIYPMAMRQLAMQAPRVY